MGATPEVYSPKSELKSAATSTKQGLVGVATGGAILYAGFLFLLAAATFGLAQFVELWLASLIVGGAVALIGYGVLKGAQKKLEGSTYSMDRTRESLRRDTHIVGRAT